MSLTHGMSVREAAEQADWWCRYALDRLPGEGRLFHPGVGSHLTAARSQLLAVVELAHPDRDQVCTTGPDPLYMGD